MASKKYKNITYRNCSDIPIYNFDVIHKEGDYRWLMVGFDGYNEVKPPNNAGELFYEMLNEYCEIDGNRDSLDFYELQVEVSRLELRQIIVDSLLETLCSLDSNNPEPIITELHLWDMPFDVEKDFDSQLKEMLRIQRGWKTRYERKLESLKELTTESEPMDLITRKVALEGLLEKNHIDIKKISAREWLELGKRASKIYNARLKWQMNN